ncbi:hypothetical protein CGRA01v4_15013 [Colletotrichum graminicola]|nr:hypothetical protein CGRA01v4_15013 [Colletotrichum graminicola]
MAASTRRSSSAVPPLTQTLNVLNALDPSADVETLWAQLRQAFSLSSEQPSDKPAAFPIFAFTEVRRPILEIATEKQYRNDLSRISNDQKTRLRGIAKQLDISPAIFCLLFTPECAASRTCTNSLAELRNAHPDLSLSSILQVFVSQSAALESAKRGRRSSSRIPNTALKSTIQHFDARIWQKQAPSTAKRHLKTFRTRPAKISVSALSDISEEDSQFPTLPKDRQPTPADNDEQAVNNASDEDEEYIRSRDDGDATWGDGEHSDAETDKETSVCHLIKSTR